MYQGKRSFLFLLPLFFLVLLPGCMGRHASRVRKFPEFRMGATCQAADNRLKVIVEELSSTRCEDYFGFDVKSYGYHPLMVEFANYTSDEYVLRPSYIGLDYVSGKKIAQEMHYNTTFHMQWMIPPALWYRWELIPFLVIPSGFWMRDCNKRMTRNIRRHSLSRREALIIHPYETVRKFIFVEDESYKRVFDLSLFNTSEHARTHYMIDLRKKQAIQLA
jgi:hypothetical protein